MKTKMVINDIDVSTRENNKVKYISLTDIAKAKNPTAPADVIKNWMRTHFAIEFMGLWESLHNPNVKLVDFDQFKNDAGSNAFTMSPAKWIDSTNAIGVISRSGNGGGTFAHPDIAFEFASWVSAEFKLYLVKEFQRLKVKENAQLEWNAKRELAKINYRLHTDSIKENLVPILTPDQQMYVYQDESDMLNVALFGLRASEWRKQNPDLDGNMRDHTTVHHLLVLANMESYNAEMIRQGVPMSERITKLNDMAKYQLPALKQSNNKLLTQEDDK